MYCVGWIPSLTNHFKSAFWLDRFIFSFPYYIDGVHVRFSDYDKSEIRYRYKEYTDFQIDQQLMEASLRIARVRALIGSAFDGSFITFHQTFTGSIVQVRFCIALKFDGENKKDPLMKEDIYYRNLKRETMGKSNTKFPRDLSDLILYK